MVAGPGAGQLYTFARPLTKYSSSTYPSLDRSSGTHCHCAPPNGCDASLTGNGPVTVGTGTTAACAPAGTTQAVTNAAQNSRPITVNLLPLASGSPQTSGGQDATSSVRH